jgi:hypothetical protein
MDASVSGRTSFQAREVAEGYASVKEDFTVA